VSVRSSPKEHGTADSAADTFGGEKRLDAPVFPPQVVEIVDVTTEINSHLTVSRFFPFSVFPGFNFAVHTASEK
jgi:hypothetical protein